MEGNTVYIWADGRKDPEEPASPNNCWGPPAAPQNLVITNAGQLFQNPNLAWSANTEPDLDRYDIYRKVQPEFPNTFFKIGSTTNTTFTDAGILMGLPDYTITYYVIAVDIGGQDSPPSNTASTTGIPLGKQILTDRAARGMPKAFALQSPSPNPFNPVTTLRYNLPQASRVNLAIYNLAGSEIRSWERQEPAGYRHVTWDGRDESGQQAPTGIYIYRLAASPLDGGEPFVASRKMVLLK